MSVTDEMKAELKRIKAREYYLRKRETILQRQREKYASELNVKHKEYYVNNREQIRAKQNQRYQDKHDQYLNIMRTYQQNNKEKCKAATLSWLGRNPEKHKEYAKRYYERNKEAILQRAREKLQLKNGDDVNISEDAR